MATSGHRRSPSASIPAGALVASDLASSSVTTAKLAAGAVTGSKLAAGAVKLRTVAGRNGAGSLIVAGAVSTDTLEKVLNVTDGGDVTTDFSATVGTGALTQTGSTDYSAKVLLVQLKAA